MKKQLLATTALVLAGAIMASGSAFAAEKKKKATPPKLTVGGYWEEKIGFADNDASDGDRVGFDIKNDAEIYFSVNHKLDNGIGIKGRIEMEGDTSSDNIDELNFTVSGAFGQIRIGSEDNVAALMGNSYMAGYGTEVGTSSSGKGATFWTVAPAGTNVTLSTEIHVSSNDANKIAYFTPRIEGFQFGVGWTPSGKENNASIAKTSDDDHDGWDVAMNFDRTFDKVGIGFTAGFATIQHKATGVNKAETDGDTDRQTSGISARLKFAGATVAATYTQARGTKVDNTSDGDYEIFSIGGNYKWGANAISLTYLKGENEGTSADPDSDVSELINIGYARTLGPGVSWRTTLLFADFEGEDSSVTTDDNDAFAIVTGLKLSF